MESLFSKAVEATLKNWNPLQFAIHQMTGGYDTKDKANWFMKVVEDFFYKNDDLDPDEVADFISAIMDKEFHTLVEDDSDLEVSSILCRFFRMSRANENEKIMEELSKIPVSSFDMDSCVVQEPADDVMDMDMTDQMTEMQIREEDENIEEERELTELEKQQAQDEADGWTIQRKGRSTR